MAVASHKAPDLNIERLAKIKLLSLDVDGVLTDGGIYYTDSGDSFRKFNAKDGMGIVHLQAAGIPVCIISMGMPGAIDHRAKRLGIKYVYTDVADKAAVIGEVARELGISLSEVGHIGDDINDLPLFELVGVRISVADGMTEVMEVADVISTKPGGAGAVREITDIIRHAQGAAQLTAVPAFN